MSRDRLVIFGLFIAALGLTLPTLGLRDIVTSHEGRVAQTARQMSASGWPWNAAPLDVPAVTWQQVGDVQRLLPDPAQPPLRVNPWIVPVINGQIRLQKPPLPYWCTAVMFKLFGANEWAARLMPAVLGALLTLIVADLAGRLIRRRAAVWAAAVWVSSYFVFDEFRKCMADPYTAFSAIAAVWAWIRGNAERGTLNAERNADGGMRVAERRMPSALSFVVQRPAFIVLFYLLLALGVLSKGPAVFVPVAAGVIAFGWTRGWRRTPWQAHAIGAAVFLLLALPWFGMVLHQVPNARELWEYEAIGGFGEKGEKPQPFWWYLPELLLISLPWTPLWIAGIVLAVRHRSARVALLWQAMVVVIFSLITQKKNAYLLPAMAAQTLLITQGLRWLFAAKRTAHLQRPIAVAAALLAIGIAAGIGWDNARDNVRSPRAMGLHLKQALPSSGATLEVSLLPADAAFYLPLNPPAGDPKRRWVVLDDRRNAASATPQAFAGHYPDQQVESVRRLDLSNGRANDRWKLFEVVLK